MKTKKLVYVASQNQLLSLYDEFLKCDLVKKYPKYLAYFKFNWSMHCFFI